MASLYYIFHTSHVDLPPQDGDCAATTFLSGFGNEAKDRNRSEVPEHLII